MALKVGELFATLGLDKSEYDRGLGQAKKDGQGAGDFLGKALKVGALAAAGGLAAASGAAVKFGLDFKSSMSEVRTLLPDISDEAFGKLEQDVLDFSREMGIATDQAVPALYQAISAGVPQENVFEFMEVASQAAVGGVTDLETAVDGITSVVNAYGAETISAQEAADVMFAAVKNGKTDFEQLSASLFNVIPTASSLGVAFEDVTAQIALMTAQGTPTSVATTQIRAAMVEAQKSGTNLDKAIKELTGSSFAALIEQGETMPGVFQMLRQSMPEQDFKDLFGSVEAMNAALGVTGPNFEKFSGFLDAAEGSAGAVGEAFNTVAENPAFRLQKALNALKIRLTEAGVKAMPIVIKAADLLILAMDKLGPLMGEVSSFVSRRLIPALRDLGQRYGPIVRAEFESLSARVRELARKVLPPLMAAWESLSAFFMETALPAFRAISQWMIDHQPVVAALAIAVGLLAAPWLTIGVAVAALILKWDELVARFPVLQAVFDAVTGAVATMREWIADRLVPALTEAVQKFRNDVLPALENVGKAVLAVIALALTPLIATVKTVARIVKENFDRIVDYIRAAIDLVVQIVETGIELLRDTISVILALLRGDWEGAWNGIKTLLSNVWENIGEIVDAGIEYIQSALSLAWGVIESAAGIAWDGITGVIKGAINGIIGMINAMTGAISALEIRVPGVSIPLGPDIPGFTIGIPDIPPIPLLARGGRGRGGLAILGESGPELVDLPGGTDVHSNRATRDLLGGSPQVIINAPNYLGPESMLAEPVKRVLVRFQKTGVLADGVLN